MKIESCSAINSLSRNYGKETFAYELNKGYYKASDVKIYEHALKRIDQEFAKDVATHEANKPALEHNQEAAKRIESLMKELGIPNEYYARDLKSRARFPKTIRYNSGYIEDISRHLPVDDGFASSQSRYKMLKDSYNKYLLDAQAAEVTANAQRARDEEEKKKLRMKDMELADIKIRYNIDINAEWDEVFEILCEKNQRLNLAFAMQSVREDWNDGCGRVSSALGSFETITEEDKAIYEDVSSHCQEFEDGRCFRDCEWNYGRLFASIEDKKLLEDAEKAYSHRREY